jgi:hypothetical protein
LCDNDDDDDDTVARGDGNKEFTVKFLLAQNLQEGRRR